MGVSATIDQKMIGLLMKLDELIKEIHSHLNDVDDLSQLSDWNLSLSSEFAVMAEQLALVKRDRAMTEIQIKQDLISKEGKYTEKEIERQYFSTESGKFYVYATEMLKAVGRLISAVRFKIKMLDNPLN